MYKMSLRIGQNTFKTHNFNEKYLKIMMTAYNKTFFFENGDHKRSIKIF